MSTEQTLPERPAESAAPAAPAPAADAAAPPVAVVEDDAGEKGPSKKALKKAEKEREKVANVL